MGPALTCFDSYMETSYLWVFKVQIQIGVDLKFQEGQLAPQTEFLCAHLLGQRESSLLQFSQGENWGSKTIKEMLSPQRVAQGSAARNEWTNALHASVVKGWSVYECFFVPHSLTMQMVLRGFEVKAPGKEKCSHLGFQCTRAKVK